METRLACLVGVSLGILGAACGGGSAPKEPTTGDVVPSASAAAPVPAADVAAAPGASSAPSSVDAGGVASSSPPATSAPSGSSAPSEPQDECTPVGVDFEKRVRPKLKECYATAKKKEPNLEGKVRIGVDIDMLGKVKSIKVLEKTLPDPVADCMLKAVKATPLPDAGKCPGKSITIPVQFPTPR